MNKDNLGKRMKEYEKTSRTFLTKRIPIIIRIDGKAFHTFIKGFKKPFDDILMGAMWETTKYLCKNIQGCKLGYTQSDEISLLLTNYENIDTCAWFDNNIQKMVSISASMATLAFNNSFRGMVLDELAYYKREDESYHKTLKKRLDLAMFDSRAFTLPKEEVVNYFIWRQQDATRNSVQMVGQANFSHKQLHGKSCNNIQEILFQEKGINWNDIPTYQKRGVCIIKEQYKLDNEQKTLRNRWIVDKNIPVFTQNRDYIEKVL